MRTSTAPIMLGITGVLLILNPLLWALFPILEPFIQQTSNKVELWLMIRGW